MNTAHPVLRHVSLGLALVFLVSCTTGASPQLPAIDTTFPHLTPTIATTLVPSAVPAQTQSINGTSLPPTPPTPALPGLTPTATRSPNLAHIKTVFLIVMENHKWSDILNSPSAPYINKTLLPQASYAQQYYNPPRNHPSEPNYLWLEAGTNFGINNDNSPQDNHQSSTNHLVTLLNKAGITWKAYEEGISGKDCPLTASGLYDPKHNPMVYFDDVTNNNDSQSAYCIQHERPFSELQADLLGNTVAQYNFLTPNLCHSMHNFAGCQSGDEVSNGDTWLSEQVPLILDSQAYKDAGVIFITWDESENGDFPIGMLVLSPFARGGGYSNTIHYTHSSTLRTLEEIFNVTPFLGDAAYATDLSALFTTFP